MSDYITRTAGGIASDCRICGRFHVPEENCVHVLRAELASVRASYSAEVERLKKLMVFDEGVVTQAAYNAMKCQMLDYKSEVERLTKERDDALSSKDHCQQWHAVRLKRLEDWFRNEGKDLTIAMEFWNIVANGTKSVNDPPTYSQQMNMLRHEVERLKAENLQLRHALGGL